MIKKDDSVELNLREEIAGAAARLSVWHEAVTGRDLVVTSGSEKIQHRVKRSAHYRGDAIDIRNWDLKVLDPDLAKWTSVIEYLLGPDFVVINENTHYHIHWGPVFSE